jgi:hypothetical protein
MTATQPATLFKFIIMKNIFITIKLLCLVVVLTINKAYSQKQIIHHNLKQDTLKVNRGPNAKKFSHSYLLLGGVVPDSKIVDPAFCHEFGFGWLKKRKLNNTFSLGYDISFSYRNYRIKDTSYYPLPPGSSLIKERLYTRNLQLKPWFRINIGKRGNTLGNYLDLGAFGEWSFARTHYYKFENPKGTPEGVKGEYLLKKNDWFLPFNYGAMLRIGFNKWSFYGMYRVSDMFKDNIYFKEMPRITAGVSYAIY